MTIEDLTNKIDWTFADEDHSAYLQKMNIDLPQEEAEKQEDYQKRSREALLDGALHLMKCKKCTFKGIRSTVEPYEHFTSCPMCQSAMVDDWESRFWARQVLGQAWEQAVLILKTAGLILGEEGN